MCSLLYLKALLFKAIDRQKECLFCFSGFWTTMKFDIYHQTYLQV